MVRAKFNADALSAIVQGLFNDAEVNTTITGGIQEWEGKNITEILNTHYYTFKHRVLTLEEKIAIMKNQDPSLNEGVLNFMKQSYCLVSIDNQQRSWSKDIDQITVDGTLEFWLQTEKVKFLEELIENANIGVCGLRIPVEIGGQNRECVIYFENPKVSGMDIESLGETSIVTIGVSLIVYPAIASYSDWIVKVQVNGEYKVFPILRINFNNVMVPKSSPMMNNPSRANNSNLSNTTSITLEYQADKDNEVAEMLAFDSLSKAATNLTERADNNKVYKIRAIRNNVQYDYDMKIQDHKLQVNNSLENETNVVVFATGGENGT